MRTKEVDSTASPHSVPVCVQQKFGDPDRSNHGNRNRISRSSSLHQRLPPFQHYLWRCINTNKKTNHRTKINCKVSSAFLPGYFFFLNLPTLQVLFSKYVNWSRNKVNFMTILYQPSLTNVPFVVFNISPFKKYF